MDTSNYWSFVREMLYIIGDGKYYSCSEGRIHRCRDAEETSSSPDTEQSTDMLIPQEDSEDTEMTFPSSPSPQSDEPNVMPTPLQRTPVSDTLHP